MIINGGEPEILRCLQVTQYEFHLTGSRYFGSATFSSDWDFFTSASQKGIVEFLESLGFEKEYGRDESGELPTNYVDSSVIAVYKLGNVHVQLVKSAIKKLVAQNAIDWRKIVFNQQPKPIRSLIWRTVMTALDFWDIQQYSR